jgi:hypothetical protein
MGATIESDNMRSEPNRAITAPPVVVTGGAAGAIWTEGVADSYRADENEA